MAYRNSRGRYGTRNSSNPDNYSPAYTTQAGYQPNQNQTNSQPQQPVNNQNNYKQQSQASAVKQEYDSSSRVKREEFQPPPVAKEVETPPVTSEETSMVQDSGEEKLSEKPWKKRTFQKLPKKVKKKRLNAKLRNLLAPKNAMMVLHELHPGLACSANEECTNTGQSSYTVVIEIDGKQYKGQGLSKAQAKQTACENALKAALYEKMTQNAIVKTETVAASPPQVMDTSEGGETVSANGESPDSKPKKTPEEDDVPWGSLASYALFKLFSEWQSQGYTLPTSPGKVLPAPPPNPSSMMPMKKMPADAAQRHPVQLLNQLKPHAQYVEAREGNPPNMVFTFTVSFDGQTFTGVGPNKKDSKKSCAKNALVSLGIQYPE